MLACVIHYELVNEKTWEQVKEFKVGEKIEVEIEEQSWKTENEKDRRKQYVRKIWNKKAIKKYQQQPSKYTFKESDIQNK